MFSPRALVRGNPARANFAVQNSRTEIFWPLEDNSNPIRFHFPYTDLSDVRPIRTNEPNSLAGDYSDLTIFVDEKQKQK